MTLWGNCKPFFYKTLETIDQSLIKKYDELYSDQKRYHEYTAHLHHLVLKYCQQYQLTPYIPRPVGFFPNHLQYNKQIAGALYLEAREMQLSGQSGYKEWAYRKAARALDDLSENIKQIYREKGVSGLQQMNGIGTSLAKKIEELLLREDV